MITLDNFRTTKIDINTMSNANLNRLVFEQLRIGVDQSTIIESLMDIGVRAEHARNLVKLTANDSMFPTKNQAINSRPVLFSLLSTVVTVVFGILMR